MQNKQKNYIENWVEIASRCRSTRQELKRIRDMAEVYGQAPSAILCPDLIDPQAHWILNRFINNL